MRQIELRDKIQPGANEIEIKWAGKGSALYAISGKQYVSIPAGNAIFTFALRP